MNAVLISMYDLGHQPFGLASLAAWLREAGADVSMADLSVRPLDENILRSAGLVAFYLPMHTATRLAIPMIARCHSVNATAHICCFGLYAPMNEKHLRQQGAQTIIGGEFETRILNLFLQLNSVGPQPIDVSQNSVALPKQQFLRPDRRGLPPLAMYAKLVTQEGMEKISGYTEASRGCKHLCRHCPVVPIYQGQFRIVQRDVVLADIRQQVSDGAEHISFGDPDFFNGVTHAVRIINDLHAEFPHLTYDVTIKIEHILRYADQISALRDTGCLFITTAVEAVDDHILHLLDKGHTRADFFEAVRLTRDIGIALAPTFVPFTPWITIDGYLQLLETIDNLGLVESVAPIQLAIRLLVPEGSYLLRLQETRQHLCGFDQESLAHRWRHPDPLMDELHKRVQTIVNVGEGHKNTRASIFQDIWRLGHSMRGHRPVPPIKSVARPFVKATVPHMTERWYCCAEPTEDQFSRI